MTEEVELLEGETRNTVSTTEVINDGTHIQTTTTVYDSHTVQQGETLSEITYDKLGDGTYDTYMEVANDNNIANPDVIHPGDVINYNVSTTIEVQENPSLTAESTNNDQSQIVSSQSSSPSLSTGITSSNTNISNSGISSGPITIEQAVIGYDKAGLQLAVERLNYGVIRAARTVIDIVVPQVRVAVDSCWNGQSADAFKAKLERDAQTMKETLDKLQEEIVNEFAQMAKNVDNYDSALADQINSI